MRILNGRIGFVLGTVHKACGRFEVGGGQNITFQVRPGGQDSLRIIACFMNLCIVSVFQRIVHL